MSKLSDVLASFGFATKIIDGAVVEAREVQKAFLENLYLAGYFKPEKIWQALNLSEHDSGGKKVFSRFGSDEGLDKAFLAISNAVLKAKAGQEDPSKFNADILLDELFEAKIFDQQDVEDLVLYLSQNAFARSAGQERNELKKQGFEELHRERYLENAKKLGLTCEIVPAAEKYDESWVQGAARFRTATRLQYLKALQDSGVDVGVIRLLTGEREMWAEIDKLPRGSIEESKEFMLEIAKENGIELAEEKFKTVVVGAATRTYLNYADGENGKVTETMMAKKLYREIFGKEIDAAEVVDSKAESAAEFSRPDTIKTAADAAKTALLGQIQAGARDLRILVVSNQPYIDRQVIANERAVRKVLKDNRVDDCDLTFDGAGEACEVGVTAVHSEFGALVSEGFAMANERSSQVRKCDPKLLSFSSRCKDEGRVPAMAIIPMRAVSLMSNVALATR